MGYLTRELDSAALSPLYPAHYRETQYHNWTPIDIIITDHTGRQTKLERWPKTSPSMHPHVEITHRETTGMRIKDVKGKQTEIPIPTKQYTVMYEEFLLYPVKVEELGVIISTEAHQLIAKNMVVESGYSPDGNESLTDFETSDPRFVFEVKDPFNRWETLYLNLLGQTITLRCGHSGNLISDLDEATTTALSESCTLSCYLRYPTNYTQDEHDVVPVFSINLKDIDLEEPYVLPSGDMLCVASSMEALQRAVDKKCKENHPSIQITGMVSKELHDKEVSDLKKRIDAEKQTAAEQMRSIRVQKDAEIAELKTKLETEKRTTSSQKLQLDYWNALHESSIDRYAREDKLSIAREKMREESLENSRKDTEAVWNALKIGGTVAAGLISFAITLLVKSSKK